MQIGCCNDCVQRVTCHPIRKLEIIKWLRLTIKFEITSFNTFYIDVMFL